MNTFFRYFLSGVVGSVGLLAGAQSNHESEARLLIEGLRLHELREDTEVPELNVYSSYEEARKLEEEIVQMYREIRAAELSLIQRQTMKRSLESTLMPLSERAEVDQRVLTEKAKDAEAVKTYQQELGVVLQETEAIVSNARDLLNRFNEETSVPPPPEMEMPEPSTDQIAEQDPSRPVEPPTEAQIQKIENREQLAQQQVELQQQIEEDLSQVEINLEEALVEIEATAELVKEKQDESEKAIEELEKELAEMETPDPEKREELEAEKEKSEELAELQTKIEVAHELVEEVVDQWKEMMDVPEERIEKAEKVVEELREALAAVMEADQAIPDAPEHQAAKEHTEKAVEQMQAAQQAMTAAAEAMSEMKEVAGMLASMGRESHLSADMEIARIQTLEEHSHAKSGKWIDITAQMRGQNLNAVPVEVPSDQRPAQWEGIGQLRQAPTARKVKAGSLRGGDWIFVGDWYVLSRYDNAHRANIQKVYPPESILDINAQYRSEDGKRMRWEYESFLPPVIVPYGWESWKIYYFYTELMFEEDTEVWLAIGSDDRSDVWINDLPVWHSRNEHKSWNPAEGFRKVFFKKGRNKVLVRLENGQHSLGFSMYMNLSSKR